MGSWAGHDVYEDIIHRPTRRRSPTPRSLLKNKSRNINNGHHGRRQTARARRQGQRQAPPLRPPAASLGRARPGGDGGLLNLPDQRQRDGRGDAQKPRASRNRLVYRRRRRHRHARRPRQQLFPRQRLPRQEACRVRHGAAPGAQRARLRLVRLRGHCAGSVLTP